MGTQEVRTEEDEPKRPRGPYRVKGTARQLAYLEGLLTGKSRKRAAHDAGYKGKPACVVADLDRSAFNRAVHEAAEAEGVTLEGVMAKLAGLMEAKEEKAFMTRAGDVVYGKAQAVTDVQLKATALAADLLGISGRARQRSEDEKRGLGDQGNILVLAQRYEHLSDAELEEAMQLMRAGRFEGSRLVEQCAVTVNGNGDKD